MWARHSVMLFTNRRKILILVLKIYKTYKIYKIYIYINLYIYKSWTLIILIIGKSI